MRAHRINRRTLTIVSLVNGITPLRLQLIRIHRRYGASPDRLYPPGTGTPKIDKKTVDIRDGNGNVLNSQGLTTSFVAGVYLVWNVSGHVQIRVSWTGGWNAVASGLFFDTTGTGVTFVRRYTAPGTAGRIWK